MRTLTGLQGNSQSLDGGAMFGNAPKALWARWMTPDEHNRIVLGTRALLCQDNERNILFEAGIGAFFEPKMRKRYGVREDEHVLLESLDGIGLKPKDIDIVVLSHLHFDHAGGLLSHYIEGTSSTLVFENAHYVVGEKAWERAQTPHARDRASFIPGLTKLLQESNGLELVSSDSSTTLGAGFRFWHSDGHTPGMLLSEIDMPSGPVVFAADLIPGRPWIHLPITMGYDRFPEQLINEKKILLESLLKRNGRLFFTHDMDCSMANLSYEDSRYGPKDERVTIQSMTS